MENLQVSLSLSLRLLLGSRLFIFLFTSCTIITMLFKIKILYYYIVSLKKLYLLSGIRLLDLNTLNKMHA